MTTRTFTQKGQAYGSTTASIVVTIDGNIVYSGPANTLNEPLPTMPVEAPTFGVDLFTWTNDVAFSGTQTLEIAVTGSDLLVTDTLANYIWIDDPDNPGQFIAGGPTNYGSFYSNTVDGVVYSDPFTDEEIDGAAQSGPPDPALSGQWWWVIPAGSTFSATVNIQAGVE